MEPVAGLARSAKAAVSGTAAPSGLGAGVAAVVAGGVCVRSAGGCGSGADRGRRVRHPDCVLCRTWDSGLSGLCLPRPVSARAFPPCPCWL